MKKIALHSMVLVISTSKLQEQDFLENFDSNEILSKKTITERIFGKDERHICQDLVNSELNRMINLKLSLGERVVLCENNFSKNRRMFFGSIAKKYGVPIYYVIMHDDSLCQDKIKEVFLENEREILFGDGLASVVDTRVEKYDVIKKMPFRDLFVDIKRKGWTGITVAGDVHGNLEGLKNSLDWALGRNMLYLQLGDIVDYGPHPLECVNILYDRYIRGYCIFTIGNHDRKIERWLLQENMIKKKPNFLDYNPEVNLSEANKVTVEKIKKLSEDDRRIFESRFNCLMNGGRYHYNIGNCVFSHAGIIPEMFSMNVDRLYGKFESICLHGSHEDILWEDTLYGGKTIFVGHTIKNRLIPVKVKIKDCEVVYQDTGSGKGGYLSTTDLIFKENNLIIQSHNRW